MTRALQINHTNNGTYVVKSVAWLMAFSFLPFLFKKEANDQRFFGKFHFKESTGKDRFLSIH